MRLNPLQVDTIKNTTKAVFGENTSVYLFGSRVDDTKKGGDIDLLIIPTVDFEKERDKINSLKVKLILSLGDQKIDIIVKRPSDVRYIIEVAINTGIEL